MAKYSWKYDNRVFTSLKEVKAAVRELVEAAQEKQGAELLYAFPSGKAVYEIVVDVKLRPH